MTSENEVSKQVWAERMEVLDRENELWTENCTVCTKIYDAKKLALESGDKERIKETKWLSADRENPICSKCPTHYELRKCGDRLVSLMTYIRALR